MLVGQKPVKSTKLYVRNIRKEETQSDDEISKMVKAHVWSKGVRIMAAKIIHNRFDDNTVGCKITVPELEEDNVSRNSFWPDEVECRSWNTSRQGPSRRNGIRPNYNRDDNYYDSNYRGNRKYYDQKSKEYNSDGYQGYSRMKYNSTDHKEEADYWDNDNEGSYATRDWYDG